MPLVFGPFSDPLLQSIDLRLRQRLAARLGRHLFIGILRENATNDFARRSVIRNDTGMPGLKLGGCPFALIKSKSPFAMLGVWTMTQVAIVRENRSHIAIEFDLLIGREGNRTRDDQADAGCQ